jgi:hypothetical protein
MPARAITVVLTAAAVLAAALIAAAAAPAPAQAAGDGGGCGASGYQWGYGISCQSGSRSPGTPGQPAAAGQAGTSGVVNTPCALYPIAGNPTHMLQVCPHGLLLNGGRNGVSLINATNTVVPIGGAGGGAPAITPQQLLAWAQNQLTLPLPGVRTAPPRGNDGLVGLPEWFWIDPAQWHPQTARVAVGGVWAQVTATPQNIQIQPGTGAAGTGLTCHGPGTPYNPKVPASGQHSNCTYTYAQSSDGLPGNAYPASVTVTWTATWQGSGGAGGALPPLGRTTAFPLPVAEAQAINPTSNSGT